MGRCSKLLIKHHLVDFVSHQLKPSKHNYIVLGENNLKCNNKPVMQMVKKKITVPEN